MAKGRGSDHAAGALGEYKGVWGKKEVLVLHFQRARMIGPAQLQLAAAVPGSRLFMVACVRAPDTNAELQHK